MPDFRIVPSIEQLRIRPRVAALQERYGHAAVVEALRAGTASLRQQLSSGADADGEAGAERPATADEAAAVIESGLETRLQAIFQSSLRPVVNATGVIVHTNLGRAPLCQAALDQVVAVGRRYSTLEYDLAAGRRGHRDEHAAQLLCRLTARRRRGGQQQCRRDDADPGGIGRGPRGVGLAWRTRRDWRRVPGAQVMEQSRAICGRSVPPRIARGWRTTRPPSPTRRRSFCGSTVRISPLKDSPNSRRYENWSASAGGGGPRRRGPGSGNLAGGLAESADLADFARPACRGWSPSSATNQPSRRAWRRGSTWSA